jgi:hypothetical protein
MSELLSTEEADAVHTNGSQKFDAELANGMHAMAQPLTVVQGALEALRMPPAAGRNPERYLDLASQQIARACHLFGCVQDLMALRLVEPRRERFDWRKAVSSLVERQTAKLQTRGISLALAESAPWRPATGDPQRAEGAVSAALGAAAALASRGDTIRLILDSSTDANELTILNPGAQVQRVDSSTRLYLFLAEENIFSQSGAFRYAEDPFCISLILPAGDAVRISVDGRPFHRPPLR